MSEIPATAENGVAQENGAVPENGNGEKKVVPVTVLTGFLGSGKTTMINHILQSQSHGMRLAIIENEFGAVGIDDRVLSELVGEEMIEVMNGCICCTVRGDLVKVLKKMYDKVHDFDGVIIETTGLADPAPVAQTFFLDDDIGTMYRLDGICTVIDAKHIIQHLEEEKPEGVENEAVEQVAFADRILLNKTDLVDDESELDAIEARLRAINKQAPVLRCQHGEVDPNNLLDLKAFELDRVLEMDPEFLATDGEHQHDSTVTSVSCKFEGDLHIAKMNVWIGKLLETKSNDLFRYKGILAIKGCADKYIFQGVHMLFNGTFSKALWQEGEPRECRFVFIGKNLDQKELMDGLMECQAADTLRFSVGDAVRVYFAGGTDCCSEDHCSVGTWQNARIVTTWDRGDPYKVELEKPDENGKRKKWVPRDDEDHIRVQEESGCCEAATSNL